MVVLQKVFRAEVAFLLVSGIPYIGNGETIVAKASHIPPDKQPPSLVYPRDERQRPVRTEEAGFSKVEASQAISHTLQLVKRKFETEAAIWSGANRKPSDNHSTRSDKVSPPSLLGIHRPLLHKYVKTNRS